MYFDYYLKNRLENHSNIKEELLSLIEKTTSAEKNSDGSFIAATDYGLKNNHKYYANFFVKNIVSIQDKIAQHLHAVDWNIESLWYQIYLQGNNHNWHNHGATQFANVYYINLPEDSVTTEIYVPFIKRTIEINAQEGDLVTFPGFYPHRSISNKSKEEKIIISFNSSFYVNGNAALDF